MRVSGYILGFGDFGCFSGCGDFGCFRVILGVFWLLSRVIGVFGVDFGWFLGLFGILGILGVWSVQVSRLWGWAFRYFWWC